MNAHLHLEMAHNKTNEETITHHGVTEILGNILRNVDQLTISGCD